MALLTVPQLKKRLGLTENDDDADLADIVAGATAAVKAFLGYDPEGTSFDVELNPNGGSLLTLPDAPPSCTVTVTSVYESYGRPPVYDSTTLLTVNLDYRQEREGGSALIRVNANWPAEWRREADRLAGNISQRGGAVRVVYTVSNSLALAAAKRAAMLEALSQWNVTNGGFGLGAVTGESVDGLSETVNTSLLPQRKDAAGLMSPVAAAVLGPFRKVGSVVA